MDESTPQHETAAQAKKRRFSRVSRACVECRIRKVRCNAQQPCEPCEDFNRRCVYSSTKAQRTGGAPRTKILEDRLRRARALIAQLQAENPSVRHRAEINAIFDTPPGSPDSASEASQHAEEPQTYDADALAGDLENMMDGQGRFTASDDNNLAYFGGVSTQSLRICRTPKPVCFLWYGSEMSLRVQFPTFYQLPRFLTTHSCFMTVVLTLTQAFGSGIPPKNPAVVRR
jgi:hypothetical protein